MREPATPHLYDFGILDVSRPPHTHTQNHLFFIFGDPRIPNGNLGKSTGHLENSIFANLKLGEIPQITNVRKRRAPKMMKIR